MAYSQWIGIDANDGGRFEAYLSLPASGRGPVIVLLQEIFGVNASMRAVADLYAEEGWVVLVPDLFWRMQPRLELSDSEEAHARALEFYQRFDEIAGMADIAQTIETARALPAGTGGIGVLGFCLGGRLAVRAAAACPAVDCAVSYYGVGIDGVLDAAAGIRAPLLLQFGATDPYSPPAAIARIGAALPGAEIVSHPGVGHAFARPGGAHFDKRTAALAHTRTVAFLRREIGPVYDLAALWEKHCEYEFALRDVDATMATMVAEPYVNHIPTMTGGVGWRDLYRFYRHHFVDGNPDDTMLVPVSRTIGSDRLVDEMLFCFTHDREIDWILPGVKPTGRRVEVPLVAIVCFRGDRLYHEHIHWDQASVLVQTGLLDPAGLPVAGVETARKLVDETLPSNTLMRRWAESENSPAGQRPAGL